MTVEGDGLRLRRATGDDVDFVVGLLNEEDTAPFLAASRSRDRAGVLEDVKASTEEPGDSGLFVIEVPDDHLVSLVSPEAFSKATLELVQHVAG